MEKIFQNGSVWLRADFHLHTKSDREFCYSGKENDFVKEYINKLMEQSISVGVITNHNKFNKDEFTALKKRAWDNGISLFPGVEFSLKEGIHILIVFEEAWYKGQDDNINKFLANAFYGIDNPANPPYPNSTFDLEKVVENLNKIPHNYFIILAHIDSNNGLCKVLKRRTFEAFIKQDAFDKVLAVQKSGNLENYKLVCKWAEREIACVEGSDNAENGIGAIGEGKKTYLKIGDFNFEAIQYALTDPQNRVRPKEVPKIYNSYIKSMAIEGGLLNGEKISFSPELNSLIGIRGSGKSSILEILRFALDIPFSTQAMDKDYKNKLIEYVLKSGGKVSVEIVSKEGKIYKIERLYGHNGNIYKDDTLQPEITLDAILRQPIYFGQKDLSNKDSDFENDLVNKLVGKKLNDVRSKIDIKTQSILRIINELKTLSNLLDIKKETETAKNNATHKLQLFKEKGVAEKLHTQTSFDSDVSKLSAYKTNVDSYVNELNTIIQKHEYLSFQKLQSDINKDFFEDATRQIALLKQEFDKLRTVLVSSQGIGSNLREILLKISQKEEVLKEEFAKIKREIDIHDLNPDDFIKINRILDTSERKLIEIEKSETKRLDLNNQLMKELVQLDGLWHEKFTILRQEIEKINNSGANLAIDIEYKGRKENKEAENKENKENTFLNKLQESFKGSHIRESAYKEIVHVYADFIDIYKDGFRKLTNILNENQLLEFKTRFHSNLFDLLTYQVENDIIIKFEGKPLKEHSLGQRASALILFLLAQKENDILIIDQPEDDLDNQTIYKDVICAIKKLKGNMQFIFATHNANIPVLGDSEMLIACQYVPNNEIIVEPGSIDCMDIQSKIIGIMEGGKEAFDKRKNIYGIWETKKI